MKLARDMKLVDLYAAIAMHALLSDRDSDYSPEYIAELSYEYALALSEASEDIDEK